MSKKLYIDNLAIEVTRRCNMNCPHCMRGDAQRKDLDMNKVYKFLSQVESISSLTFTGGEPTLNVGAMVEILDYCKSHKISVMSFYVVTNGKIITSDFLAAMVEWYAYCIECGGEPEVCGVALSKDIFHDSIDSVNETKLRAFSFFRPEDKRQRFDKQYLINFGRARNLSGPTIVKRDRSEYEPYVDVTSYNSHIDVLSNSAIAFTVDGEILGDCDYEYAATSKIKLCDYNNAVDVFERIASDPSYSVYQKAAV